MQLSTISRYGLRALIRLAIIQDKTGKLVSVREIASIENVSVKYLENIFAILRKSKYIVALKGKNGGYKLNKAPEEISLFDIIECLEGRFAPVMCVLDKSECAQDPDKCSVYPVWNELNESMTHVLKNKTLKDFILNE